MQLMLYQVRVNKDEYEYIRENFGVGQDTVINALGKTQNAVQKYIADIANNPDHKYYAAADTGTTSTCDCKNKNSPFQQLVICLPCGGAPNPGGGTYEDAIEVKSAWRRLLPGEDSSRYYTTNALYYDDNGSGQLAYYNDTFALISIHIIHKTQNYPDFIFATFEHVDVEASDNYYILLSPPPPKATVPNRTEQPPGVYIVRQIGQTNRKEMHPVPLTLDQVTDRVHAQLVALNSDIIWQYYRLAGVAGQSIDCPISGSIQSGPGQGSACVTAQNPVTCTDLDPNYFMANFVIESDPFLTTSAVRASAPTPSRIARTPYTNTVDSFMQR